MYNNYEEKKAKIGRVSVSVRNNSVKLRFTYPRGKRHDINVATDSRTGWNRAVTLAECINNDIELDRFDPTLARYSPRRSQALEIANKAPNLVDLWDEYKKVSKKRVAATTIKRSWNPWEKHFLGKTPPELLEIDKASEFIQHLLTRYAVGSLDSYFSNCLMPSVNLAVRMGRIKSNPYAAITLKKKKKRKIEAYEPEEVRSIIDAFYSDHYVSHYSNNKYNHSYYAPMIEFMALTGCRPSEAHALTWDDIKHKKNKTYIRFNKAYSVGLLLDHTKTHEVRLFPVNDQLKARIKAIPRLDNKHNLMFPSLTGRYLEQKNFSKRIWGRVIKGLIDDGILEKQYRQYSLRHSFITRMVRSGEDIATIAAISGNSTETIVSFYLASKENGINIPTL